MLEGIFGLGEDLVCDMLGCSHVAWGVKEHDQRCFMRDAFATGVVFCWVAIAMLSPLIVVMILRSLKTGKNRRHSVANVFMIQEQNPDFEACPL